MFILFLSIKNQLNGAEDQREGNVHCLFMPKMTPMILAIWASVPAARAGKAVYQRILIITV